MIDYLATKVAQFIDWADIYCYTHIWVPIKVRRWVTWLDYHYFGGHECKWTEVEPEPGIEVPCEWDDKGKPTNCMYFQRTHPEQPSCQEGCVIHHRTGHHMMFWPLHWRADRGIFERICPCGIGHPDPDQGPYWKRTDQDWQWVHGCCGDCRSPEDCTGELGTDG